MKHLIPLLCVVFFGCGEKKDPNEAIIVSEIEKHSSTDSIAQTTYSQPLPEILIDLENEFKTISLPLVLDMESNLDTLTRCHEMNLDQLNFLTENFFQTEEYDDYMIDECLELYELKKKGVYDDYVDTLDLGGLKDATAHCYGRINLDTAILLLWGIHFSSYEACPFYSGNILYASVVQNGTIQRSLQLASENAGGDPPSFGETTFNLKISRKLEVNLESLSQTFEDDSLESVETSKRQYLIQW